MRKILMTKGTTKNLYEGVEANTGILSFEDDCHKQSDSKIKSVRGKGILTNRISAHLMTCLEAIGLPTHFQKSLNMREQQVRLLDPLPFVVRVRNVAAGSLVTRLGLDEGTVLPRPILEFAFKKEPGVYSVITDDHILAFQWADPYELEELVTMAYRANDYMNGMFTAIGVRLVDFTVEIGRLWGPHGELYLMVMDELSPDTMRLWDVRTNEKFYGHDSESKMIEAYQEIAIRLGIIPREGLVRGDGFNEKLAANLDDIENILANDKSRKIRSINKTPPRKGSSRT
ncbi:MAG: phosphoribosylaminoimidazolesuccinocarboxamide synthase [Alphaproteobacteria bacterium]|nr:MAG: phosphoribosylaminoimidazolesuccinocarboxamide synthase [Alphaproteobacteria bacterium]